MTEWQSNGAIKIERAKEHIRHLESERIAFLKRKPYDIRAEVDQKSGRGRGRAYIREHPPRRWGAIIGDAVHNLRTPLDYLWRMVWPSGLQPTNRRDQFPIFSSADELEARFRKEQQGTRRVVVDILRALKPYKGGNDLLWCLSELDNIDKHHLLLPVFASFAAGVMFMPVAGGIPTIIFHSVFPVEEGSELFDFPLDPNVSVETRPGFDIAFGEPEVVEGQPIIPTLHEITGVVEAVVERFSLAGLLR